MLIGKGNTDKMTAIILVLGMIFSIYGYGAFTFYVISCILCMIWVRFSYGKLDIVFTKMFCWYLLFFLLVRLIRVDFDFPLGILLNIVFLGFFCGMTKTSQFIKIYRIIANFNIALFFVQYLMKFVFGFSFLGYFPFLPYAKNSVDFDPVAYQEVRLLNFRPSALLPEPSHLAQFLLPLLCIELFCAMGKNRKIRIFVILITILFSSSGCGYVGLIVVAVMYIIWYLRKTKKANFVIYSIIVSVSIALCAGILTYSSFGQEILERQTEFSGDEETASGFVRGVRGYYIYDEMSFSEKILGISKTLVQKYADKTIFWQSFEMDNGIYLNNVQRLLINDGIICTILFLFFLLELGKRSNFAGKAIIAVFIALSFIESMYFSASMALFIVAAYLMKDERVERRVKALHL